MKVGAFVRAGPVIGISAAVVTGGSDLLTTFANYSRKQT
jgi:hypothetical protein